MKIESKLIKRIAIGKSIGIVFGGIAFFVIPILFSNADLFLRLGVWFWYTTLGAIIGLFGVIKEHPIFKISFNFWIRGTVIGAWMNFILILFGYNSLILLMQNSIFAGYSPFCLVIEGAVFGLVVDYIATKLYGDGKDLFIK